MSQCKECAGKPKRNSYVYCSNACQQEYQYKAYVTDWKNGLENGIRGINAKSTSRHLKRYLLEKYNEQCALCRWNKKHPTTGNVPLEIDHIDGNAENNTESNLRLLCPNCHSLTITFRNLNMGNGRSWRRGINKK